MFKANIEVSTIEEFKQLTEVKTVEIPKVVIQEKVKKVNIPGKTITEEVEVIKEVRSCPVCGSTGIANLFVQTHPSPTLGIVELNTITCDGCGFTYSVPKNENK